MGCLSDMLVFVADLSCFRAKSDLQMSAKQTLAEGQVGLSAHGTCVYNRLFVPTPRIPTVLRGPLSRKTDHTVDL